MAEKLCKMCEGKGYMIVPDDPEEFDKIFDHYDDMAIFCLNECRSKALEEVGSHKEKCTYCDGTGRILQV